MSRNSDFGMDKLMKNLSKGSMMVNFLSEESISNVDEYIDTGNFALNAIMSGSVYGGVPVSRVSGFAGPSGSCKTFFLLNIVRNAQAKGMPVFYFDSENAVDDMSAERMGCDVEKIVHITATTIEQVQEQASNILNHFKSVNEERNEHNKENPDDPVDLVHPLIIIDSLGNLLTRKEEESSLDGSISMDQGLRAKVMGTMLRVLSNMAASTRSTVCFSNHQYGGPEMFPSLVKKQSGGSKVIYLASVLVQTSQVLEKIKDNVDAEKSKISTKTVGRKIHALTIKNRFIVGELECDLHLNYKTGLDPYSGLFDIAMGCGYLRRDGLTYYVDATNEKLGRQSSFDNKEFWDSHMKDLDETIKRETSLSRIECVKTIKEESNEHV